ncbi:response regulator [Roseovarius sp. C7]|uniref:response regulator n=1 Tax=Roseovarius sp. C7 TaxID=3398643 RepID=UPI0039F6F0E4
MDDATCFHPVHTPNAGRPLLGMTILAVEDSLYASDALRLMCLHSGARIRRADCLRSARRHLQVYRPSAILVDLGLPDGTGEELIADLNTALPRVAAIIGTSGDDNAAPRAMSAGADAFLPKPVANVGTFQNIILNALPPDRQPSGPRLARDDVIHPDPMAYRDDLSHVALLVDGTPSPRMLRYISQFLTGIARTAEDNELLLCARTLGETLDHGESPARTLAQLAALLQDRVADRAAM